MSSTVLTFVIVGLDDHPIFEADLAVRGQACALLCTTITPCASMSHGQDVVQPHVHPGEASARDDRAQYLHQFVLHAALDAVEEQQWQTTSMSLGVVDKFNNLQARGVSCPTAHAHSQGIAQGRAAMHVWDA